MTVHRTRGLFGIVTVAAVIVGCSSAAGRREEASRGTAAPGGERPVAVAVPSRRAPEVIRRPKPFRIDDAVGATRQTASAAATAPAPFASAAGPRASTAPGRIDADQAARQAVQHPAAGEIRGMMRDYLRAFNRHDAAAVAAHWSPTGENHDLDAGVVTAAGRDSVRQVFAALFRHDDEALVDLELTAIRPVTDDVALVDGVTTIAFTAGPPTASRFSAVVVKRDGHWLLEHVRESARDVPAVVETARHRLDDVAWLVGSWEDDGEGVTASTRCDWAGNQSYLVRTHVVMPDRGPTTRPADDDQRIPGLLPAGAQKPREVMEVIGWDPDSRAIRSWFFAGDGRFAEATWARSGDGWTIHVVGRGRDEGCTADLTLAANDDHAVFTIGGDPGRLTNLLPPACRFGRTAR